MQYYAVIDTNVLVSAMLKFHSFPGQIVLEALLGNIVPLLNDEIITEYKEVLIRPKFKFNHNSVKMVIEGIIDRGIFIDAIPVSEILPDPKDVVFYQVIMEAKNEYDSSYLVTGNIKHFPIKPFIVTPKEMFDIIHNST